MLSQRKKTSLRVPAVWMRPATKEDEGLLREIYGGTRADLLSFLPPDLGRQLVDQQHEAQEAAWSAYYPGMERLIILNRSGEAKGRLYRQWRSSGLWIIDLALLPGARSAGLGVSVLQSQFEQAAAAGVPVRGHVKKDNEGPLNLFQRMGFEIVGDAGEYVEVCWPLP